jgi:hypothetical protein
VPLISGGGGGGGVPAGTPSLIGPIALLTGAAPESQTLFTANVGDVIIDMWVEVTQALDASAAYEIYCAALDFLFPQAGTLSAVAGDTTRYAPNAHPQRLASYSYADTPDVFSVPSRMKATHAVTCDHTGGLAGGAASFFCLIVRA